MKLKDLTNFPKIQRLFKDQKKIQRLFKEFKEFKDQDHWTPWWTICVLLCTASNAYTSVPAEREKNTPKLNISPNKDKQSYFTLVEMIFVSFKFLRLSFSWEIWLCHFWNGPITSYKISEKTNITSVTYLSSLNFRTPLIFAQQKCAKIKRARKRYFRAENEKIIGQKQTFILQMYWVREN